MKCRNRIVMLCGSVVEVVILIIFGVFIFRQPQAAVDLDLSQWSSEYIEYKNDVWSVDADELEKKTVDLIYGPYISLAKGEYTVEVSYACDEDQELQIYSTRGGGIHANAITLGKNKTQSSYDFALTENIDNLEIVIKYNGNGACTIKDISIVSNTNILKKRFVLLFFLFCVIDIFYIFFQTILMNKNLILFILGTVLCASLPVFMAGMHCGDDMIFHLMRIEGIAEELKNGSFPVRIQSLWMDGYGYAVSIYYGDALLYFPALLRLAGFPIIICFKCYIVLINLGTAVASFYSFRKIFKKQNIAKMLMLVYMMASYRLVNIYIRSAVGEFTAMMYFPIVAASVYGIYTETDYDWKKYWNNAMVLMFGMSGLITNHILSTEMVCIVLVLLGVALIRKTFTRKVIYTFLYSIVGTIFLSLYFLVPFVDYYINCYVNINNTVAGDLIRIGHDGANLTQYFAFWQNIYREGGLSRFQMTPGLVLMAVLMVSLILWYCGRANKKMKLLASFSIFFLFAASNMFPWDFIASHLSIANLFTQVQFPWRYLGIAIVFLTLLSGELFIVISQYNIPEKILYVSISGICILMACWFSSSYCDAMCIVNFYDTAELNTRSVMGAEYLLADTDINLLSNEITSKNMEEVKIIDRAGTYMEIFCSAGDTEGAIELPLCNYKGYKVVDEAGNQYNIVNGNNNVVSFAVPAGFSGKLTVQFVEPWYWKLAMCISAFCWLGFLYNSRKFPLNR